MLGVLVVPTEERVDQWAHVLMAGDFALGHVLQLSPIVITCGCAWRLLGAQFDRLEDAELDQLIWTPRTRC